MQYEIKILNKAYQFDSNIFISIDIFSYKTDNTIPQWNWQLNKTTTVNTINALKLNIKAN